MSGLMPENDCVWLLKVITASLSKTNPSFYSKVVFFMAYKGEYAFYKPCKITFLASFAGIGLAFKKP